MKSANDTVSDQITAKLLESGLITAEDAKKLSVRISQGSVKDSDWLTLLRMGILKKDPVKLDPGAV